MTTRGMHLHSVAFEVLVSTLTLQPYQHLPGFGFALVLQAAQMPQTTHLHDAADLPFLYSLVKISDCDARRYHLLRKLHQEPMNHRCWWSLQASEWNGAS